MRPYFTNRISFFEPELFGGFDAPTTHPPMFFVGIQREATPPICFGQSRLQRMRIIFVEPERASGATEADGEPPFELLPPLPVLPHRRALQPRLVNGEILRDENDEFYERIGNRIRRLRTLAAGPNGEVIDIERTDTPEQQSTYAAVQEPSTKSETSPHKADAAASFRLLLPEPGQWRVVTFGAFKQILAPQLAYPERLRDVHRLPCHASVFEVTAPQQLEQLGKTILGEAAAGQLQLLTPPIVMQLQLGSVLPPPQLHPVARAHGIVLPGDRVFHLRLTNDPTADETVAERGAVGVSAPGYNVESTQSLKANIPEALVRPSEFQISREEALYDLSYASTFLGSLGSKLRRLAHFIAFRHELRKWQMLLHGKTADEQLWSVRPPRGGLTHRFIQAWAQSALQLAGYDSRQMLTEWQIFWRRKGV
jgi:hypothetical protein